ncbi:TPA: hypothetical protein ACH3X1_006815 [Trebouxia sp. C0004]
MPPKQRNTALHDTSRVLERSQPCTQELRDKWDKGEKIKTNQSIAAPQRAITPSNSLTEEHNLPLLEGVEYSQKEISGDRMANSLNNSAAWTQRLLFKGLAIITMGAQKSAESCRNYTVDTANRAMPNLGMQLAERRFYNSGNKGVQGFCAKPTTNPAATAKFLATYDAKGSPLAELQIFNEAGRICRGAPSVVIYDDPAQEVVMTSYLEDSVGIFGRTEAEKISKMLNLTMRQAMTELTDEHEAEGKYAAFTNTNGQPMSKQVNHSTRAMNAYLLRFVLDSSMCALAQMLTR